VHREREWPWLGTLGTFSRVRLTVGLLGAVPTIDDASVRLNESPGTGELAAAPAAGGDARGTTVTAAGAADEDEMLVVESRARAPR
jgi:hypothetical protein